MIRRVGLVVVVLFTCVAATTPTPGPQLVITEIMYDPSSGETDEVQTEWVEIRNVGPQAVNLKGLQISSGTRGKLHDAVQRFVLPEAVVAPGDYAIIAVGTPPCYANLGLPAMAAHCDEDKYAWLTNSGDSVAIRDAKGGVIDEVVYSADAPWPSVNRSGASIQFEPPDGQDPQEANDDAKNWVASSAGNSDAFDGHGRATPGGPPKNRAASQPSPKTSAKPAPAR